MVNLFDFSLLLIFLPKLIDVNELGRYLDVSTILTIETHIDIEVSPEDRLLLRVHNDD